MSARAVVGLIALLFAVRVGAVEVNRASQADLEAIKGVGTVLSGAIVGERTKRPFASWLDLRARVKGIGPAKAESLSAAGLTVGGAAYATEAAASAPR